METRAKIKNRFVMAVAILIAIALVGWGTPVLAETPKDTLVIGITELPPTLDPEYSEHPMAWYFWENLGDTLLAFARMPSDKQEGVRVLNYNEYEYRLAEKFDMSEDGKKITWHLRKGVKSPYGNEFTADDVLYRFQRGLAQNSLAAFFAGVMDLKDVDSIKIIDKHTITFTAEKPNALLAMTHAMMALAYWDSTEVKKHATAADPWSNAYLAKNAPTFGPYMVKEWTPGRQTVWEANPNFWQEGFPRIKKVIIKVIPESSSRVALLRAGAIDIAHELSPREIASLRGVPGVKTIEDRGYWETHIVLNDLKVKPFGNKLVRQAVNYALNREKIIDMAYFGMAEPMMVCPRQHQGPLDPKEFPYHYNIEKAKELMKEAGYGDGFDVELYYQAGILPHETMAIIMKEDLSKIGINVTLRKTPIGALETEVLASKSPFAIWRSSPFMPDPNYCATHMYLNGHATGGTGYCNYTGFNDPVVNMMINSGKQIIEPVARIEFHRALQRIIIDRAPIGFAIQEGYYQGVRDNIEGWSMGIGESCRYGELSKR